MIWWKTVLFICKIMLGFKLWKKLAWVKYDSSPQMPDWNEFLTFIACNFTFSCGSHFTFSCGSHSLTMFQLSWVLYTRLVHCRKETDMPLLQRKGGSQKDVLQSVSFFNIFYIYSECYEVSCALTLVNWESV